MISFTKKSESSSWVVKSTWHRHQNATIFPPFGAIHHISVNSSVHGLRKVLAINLLLLYFPEWTLKRQGLFQSLQQQAVTKQMFSLPIWPSCMPNQPLYWLIVNFDLFPSSFSHLVDSHAFEIWRRLPFISRPGFKWAISRRRFYPGSITM